MRGDPVLGDVQALGDPDALVFLDIVEEAGEAGSAMLCTSAPAGEYSSR